MTLAGGTAELSSGGYLLTAQDFKPTAQAQVRITAEVTFTTANDFVLINTHSSGPFPGTNESVGMECLNHANSTPSTGNFRVRQRDSDSVPRTGEWPGDVALGFAVGDTIIIELVAASYDTGEPGAMVSTGVTQTGPTRSGTVYLY